MYLAQADEVSTAYDGFYDLYDSGSTDLEALKGEAGKVAAALESFASAIAGYNWPPSVPDELVDAVVDDYTIVEGGSETWAQISEATSLDDLRERLKETDTTLATTDAHTDELRADIGLPPSAKPTD